MATGVGVDTISCQREITDGGGFRVGLCFVFILGDVLGYFRPMKFKFLMHARFIDLEKREKDNYCICCAAVVASRQIVAQHLKRVVACRQIVAQHLKTVVACRQIVAQDLKAVVASRQIVAQDLMTVVASRQIVAQDLMTVVASRQIVAQNLMTVVACRQIVAQDLNCLLYTSPSPRDATLSRMPSSA